MWGGKAKFRTLGDTELVPNFLIVLENCRTTGPGWQTCRAAVSGPAWCRSLQCKPRTSSSLPSRKEKKGSTHLDRLCALRPMGPSSLPWMATLPRVPQRACSAFTYVLYCGLRAKKTEEPIPARAFPVLCGAQWQSVTAVRLDYLGPLKKQFVLHLEPQELTHNKPATHVLTLFVPTKHMYEAK